MEILSPLLQITQPESGRISLGRDATNDVPLATGLYGLAHWERRTTLEIQACGLLVVRRATARLRRQHNESKSVRTSSLYNGDAEPTAAAPIRAADRSLGNR